MLNMTAFPEFVRNVAIVGHLHHGKTALMDMLVFETHKLVWDSDHQVCSTLLPQVYLSYNFLVQTRYTDTHVLSRERGISIKSSPMSLVLSSSAGKSHLVHLIDTPGHVNFMDEVASAMRLVDGIVLVVDVVEGVIPIHCTGVTVHTYNLMIPGHGQHRVYHSARFARGCQDNSGR